MPHSQRFVRAHSHLRSPSFGSVNSSSRHPVGSTHRLGIVKVARWDLVSRNTFSWAFVGRSVTDSGIGFGLFQMISLRSHQPSACNAIATRAGIIIKSFGLRPGGLPRYSESPCLEREFH